MLWRFKFSTFLILFLLSEKISTAQETNRWKQNHTGDLCLFRKVISTFLFKEVIEEKKMVWPYRIRGKVFHNGTESKMVSPILSGTSFLVLYSAAVLLEKETVPDLFSLQNVAAVNKANKTPTWRRNGWKWILKQYKNQWQVNSSCVWSLEVKSWLYGSRGNSTTNIRQVRSSASVSKRCCRNARSSATGNWGDQQ